MKTAVLPFPLEETESRLELAKQTIFQLGEDILQTQEEGFLSDRANGGGRDMRKVHEFCKNIEEKFYEKIEKEFPDDVFVSPIANSKQDADFQWYFEPLDGRSNFVHGLSHFCTLAAICFRSTPAASLIYVPSSQDTYHALHDAGAFKNAKRIKVSDVSELEYALTASGLPQKDQRKAALREILANISVFIASGTGLRRSGSSILDICWIAEGLYDAFWERSFRAQNFYAVSLLLQEAGGQFSDFSGKKISPPQNMDYSFDFLASNSSLHTKLLQLLSQVRDLEGIN